MKQIILSMLLGLSLSVTGGCGNSGKTEEQTKSDNQPKSEKPAATDTAAAQPKESMNTNEVAVIKTAYGDMVIEFWPDVAPKTVENFKTLAKKGFYDGTAFHRIVKGFMIQGGDPLTKDPSKEARWGTGDPGYKIDAEF